MMKWCGMSSHPARSQRFTQQTFALKWVTSDARAYETKIEGYEGKMVFCICSCHQFVSLEPNCAACGGTSISPPFQEEEPKHLGSRCEWDLFAFRLCTVLCTWASSQRVEGKWSARRCAYFVDSMSQPNRKPDCTAGAHPVLS
jgi:hypothetical protein